MSDIDGPATMAACTLIAVCALYEDVHEPADIYRKARTALAEAYADVMANEDIKRVLP